MGNLPITQLAQTPVPTQDMQKGCMMPRYTSIAQFHNEASPPPTPAEQALIAACQAGAECVLGDGTRPTEPSPEREVRADLLRLLISGGSSKCDLAEYGVVLKGAWIIGALSLDFQQAKGVTYLACSHFVYSVSAIEVSFTLLNLEGSFLPSLDGSGIRVESGVFLCNGFTATDSVSFEEAKIGGTLACENASFNCRNGMALTIHGAQVGGSVLLSHGFRAHGEVRISGAFVGGQLDCDGGRFINPKGVALDAAMAIVKRGVRINHGFAATGEVRLAGMKIDGQLSCSGAKIRNQGSFALLVQDTEISGSVFLTEGFSAKGEVDLSGCVIGGALTCVDASFDNSKGYGFCAQRMHVKGEFFWQDVRLLRGSVSVASAHVGDLSDSISSWGLRNQNEQFPNLNGFTYDRISGKAPVDAATRLVWLAGANRYEGLLIPQPYSQLAKVLFEMGHDRDARKVLMERERLLAIEARRLRRIKPNGEPLLEFENLKEDAIFIGHAFLDVLTRAVVGYGYAPQRALIAMLACVLPAAVAYHYAYAAGIMVPNSDIILTSFDWWWSMGQSIDQPTLLWDDTATARHYETFYALTYAFDVFVPLVDIGQHSTWSSTTVTWPGWCVRIGTMMLEVAGWIITALGAAAVTGIIKRDRG
jgi:hypothetical protein